MSAKLVLTSPWLRWPRMFTEIQQFSFVFPSKRHMIVGFYQDQIWYQRGVNVWPPLHWDTSLLKMQSARYNSQHNRASSFDRIVDLKLPSSLVHCCLTYRAYWRRSEKILAASMRCAWLQRSTPWPRWGFLPMRSQPWVTDLNSPPCYLP